MNPPAATAPLGPDDFDALDQILDGLRQRHDEIPQWEFCEGFIAALVCGRRAIPPSEYLPALIGDEQGQFGPGLFEDEATHARFLDLWTRRFHEVAHALDQEDVESLDDERAYTPEVLDVRGAVAAMPESERAAMQAELDAEGEGLPAFAQVWALGFMFAVETWPEEWTPPRDRDAAALLDEVLQCIVALTEDDTEPPTIAMGDGNSAPSVSQARINAYGEAIWAVYDLRELWRQIGPRVETVRKTATPGRNDPCWCGSGLKFKKCHGAG